MVNDGLMMMESWLIVAVIVVFDNGGEPTPRMIAVNKGEFTTNHWQSL